VQKRFLSPKQPPVAAEPTVLVDHAMARDENRDSIQTVRVSDCALRAARPHNAGEIFVGPGFAKRYPL
jgi:hypothetical protein